MNIKVRVEPIIVTTTVNVIYFAEFTDGLAVQLKNACPKAEQPVLKQRPIEITHEIHQQAAPVTKTANVKNITHEKYLQYMFGEVWSGYWNTPVAIKIQTWCVSYNHEEPML